MLLRRLLLGVVFCALTLAAWVENRSQESASTYMQEGAVYYGSNQRPFSWYYPNQYEYYYPRRHHGNCYWINVNGTSVYTCS